MSLSEKEEDDVRVEVTTTDSTSVIKSEKDEVKDGDSNTKGESKENSDGQSQSEKQRSLFSMALSVVVTSILMQMTSLLSGLIVGVALWFVFSLIISKTFVLAGWGSNQSDNEDELNDVDILEEAYKRDLIDEEQLEDSLEGNV